MEVFQPQNSCRLDRIRTLGAIRKKDGASAPKLGMATHPDEQPSRRKYLTPTRACAFWNKMAMEQVETDGTTIFARETGLEQDLRGGRFAHRDAGFCSR